MKRLHTAVALSVLLVGLPTSAQTLIHHTGTLKSAATGSVTTTFNYTGAKTTYTVPYGATSIVITAKGAQGGSATTPGNAGGLGAVVTGTFTVTGGSVLNLLVGGAGTNHLDSASGGGGSFVATAANAALLVAGGGGGAGTNYSAAAANASLTTTGNTGYDPGRTGNAAGGSGGAGGGAGRLTGGGGGFSGNGVASGSDGGASISGPGISFLNGGAGGASSTSSACATWSSAPGGFGGGGGAGYAAAGAGGGYSGGGGTDGCPAGTGGGGGSYNGGTNPSSAVTNTGHGQIIITVPVSLPTLTNWLRGAPTSDPANRRAFVTSISALNGASNYTSSLETWTGSWQAPQAIYEHGGNLDDPTTWYQTGTGEGSTWSTGSSASAIPAGELVVDMQQVRTLARFVVFQMFSDGKTTHAYFYSHPSTSATPPTNTDAGWVLRGGGAVGAGATNASTTVTSPTTFTMTPFTSRYIKIRAQNDGTLLSPSYIELKGVKAFSQ